MDATFSITKDQIFGISSCLFSVVFCLAMIDDAEGNMVTLASAIFFLFYNSDFMLQATTRCVPQQWQPKSGLLMINDLPKNGLDAIKPCFSLSRNDSYVLSASGGMISLYNMLIFKVILHKLLYVYFLWFVKDFDSVFECGEHASVENKKCDASTTCCNMHCLLSSR